MFRHLDSHDLKVLPHNHTNPNHPPDSTLRHQLCHHHLAIDDCNSSPLPLHHNPHTSIAITVMSNQVHSNLCMILHLGKY